MLKSAPPVQRKLAAHVAIDGRPKYLIAALSGMPANVFAGVLSGREPLTPDRRARIAATLGCTEADLVE